MAYVFIHILHPVRGAIGFVIIKSLPLSHDIVKSLEITDEKSVEFEDFRAEVTNKLRKTFMQVFDHLKSLLKAYFFISLFATLFDFVEFIVQLVRFGRKGNVRYNSGLNSILGIFRACDDGVDPNVFGHGLLLHMLDVLGSEETPQTYSSLHNEVTVRVHLTDASNVE